MTDRFRSARPWMLAGVLITALVILGTVTSSKADAQKTASIPHFNEKQLPEPIPGSLGAPAVTVFIGRGPEKVGAAELLTKVHAAMAARGYTFVDLEPYIENSDLEGWWVTYVAR